MSTHERRPWGSWQVLDVGRGYKVKRLEVAPYSRLSLQTHRYRDERWVVVSGLATCTVDEQHRSVGPGGHVSVPRGAVHRIANDQPGDLVLIEVQLGSYTGEDDIVRLEDDWGRSDLPDSEAVGLNERQRGTKPGRAPAFAAPRAQPPRPRTPTPQRRGRTGRARPYGG